MLKNKLLSAMGGVEANYIEDVFSTWLYTGAAGTTTQQTITNGIDLAGKGGLVWVKRRSGTAVGHYLADTARGAGNFLGTESTNANTNNIYTISGFTSSGFQLGQSSAPYFSAGVWDAETFVSWTFRKQPKFFDVVTYTGDGQTFRTVNHNLGAMPGFIICKCTSTTSDWSVLAKMSSGSSDFIPLNLNSTASSRYGSGLTAAVSSTLFYTADLGYDGASDDLLRYNQNGATYVAYLFAHDAGGFGLTGTDNVISCGSYTGTGAAGLNVTLGYEPQWVLIKRATGGTGNWHLIDVMRGWPNSTSSSYKRLRANLSDAEDDGGAILAPTATGFTFLDWTEDLNATSATYIYIAIRRGPMKVPTTGTSVFKPQVITANGAINAGFPSDATLTAVETSLRPWPSRFSGGRPVFTNNTNAESGTSFYNYGFSQNSYDYTFGTGTESRATLYDLRRAPSYFDVVCYTGTGSATTVAHNLAAVPELMIVKRRTGDPGNWAVYHIGADLSTPQNKYLYLNSTNAVDDATVWNDTAPTSSQFTVGGFEFVNASGANFVAYLFATCPGVSKVGNYTGTGTTLQINCGFTGGARFVMIKRTDDTGDWYVWDTARGIVSGDDPHLSLNTTAAEVTTDDTIDTDSTGFVVNQVSATNVNVSSATYIFLAIA